MSNDLALPILISLHRNGNRGTAKAAQTNPVYMQRLADANLVEQADTVRTGQRGRPAIIWKLTGKARDRVRRALR